MHLGVDAARRPGQRARPGRDGIGGGFGEGGDGGRGVHTSILTRSGKSFEERFDLWITPNAVDALDYSRDYRPAWRIEIVPHR
ncbi:hypothetical protein GCM10009857_15760 [Agromyces soli]